MVNYFSFEGQTVICKDDGSDEAVPMMAVLIICGAVLGLCICFIVHYFVLRRFNSQVEDDNPKLISEEGDTNHIQEGIWSIF